MRIKKISTDKFICDKPNLTIITFDHIFHLAIINAINVLYTYNCIDLIKQFNSDVKKIILNSLLSEIYSRIVLEKEYNYILYINTSFTTNSSEIWTHFDKIKLKKFIFKEIKKISKNLPLPVLIHDGIIDLQKDCGETKDIVYKLDNEINKFKQQPINANKIKTFANDIGLIGFNNKYHSEDIKNNIFYHKYLKGA